MSASPGLPSLLPFSADSPEVSSTDSCHVRHMLPCQRIKSDGGNVHNDGGSESDLNCSGWWEKPAPLKIDGVKVSWDDFPFPTEWKVIQNSMVPNHQAVFLFCFDSGSYF